jgi:hypothetical protein
MDLGSFQACVNIPEDLIFIALRDGTKFIKEPVETFDFTDIERLIMTTEFFDFNFLKDEDFRKQNTKICPILPPPPPVTLQITGYDFRSNNISLIATGLPEMAYMKLYYAAENDENWIFVKGFGVTTSLYAPTVTGSLKITYTYPDGTIVTSNKFGIPA